MHLGKFRPWTPKNHYRIRESNSFVSCPCRKMKIKRISAGSAGSVLVGWPTTQVVSDVVDYFASDTTYLEWRFENPSDSQAEIYLRTTLEEKTGVSVGNVMYWVLTKVEAFHAGVFLGRCEFRFDVFNFFTLFGFFSQVGTVWNDKTDIPKWNTGAFQFAGALWEDDPDYQPYRTAP